MATVTISPKYQIVIPREIRETMDLVPGDKVELINLSGRIEIVPLRPIKEMRGFLNGATNNFQRETDRCLP